MTGCMNMPDMPGQLKLNVYCKHRRDPARNQYEGAFFDTETGRFEGPWIGELFGENMYTLHDVADAVAAVVEEEYPFGIGAINIQIYSDPRLCNEPLAELSSDGFRYTYTALTAAEADEILIKLREKLKHYFED